jgi:carboxymethylenebutenolidase
MFDSTDSNNSRDLGDVFDEHVRYEFEDHDVEATMKTMVKEPYVHHVPTLTGGVGYNGVYNFYKNHFIGKTPSDTNITRISRTVGKDGVVDELIVSLLTIWKLTSYYLGYRRQVSM